MGALWIRRKVWYLRTYRKKSAKIWVAFFVYSAIKKKSHFRNINLKASDLQRHQKWTLSYAQGTNFESYFTGQPFTRPILFLSVICGFFPAAALQQNSYQRVRYTKIWYIFQFSNTVKIKHLTRNSRMEIKKKTDSKLTVAWILRCYNPVKLNVGNRHLESKFATDLTWFVLCNCNITWYVTIKGTINWCTFFTCKPHFYRHH